MADAAILTEGATVAVTVIIIELEVAVVGEAQATLEVMITFTTSAFTNVVVVNTAELIPAFTPFTCH